MRENYDTSGPGKYEGEPPMVRYLDEHSEWADEEGGDVESPTGWFARFGRWLIGGDERGFVYGNKCSSESVAKSIFQSYELEYSAWYDEAF